jgi:hypothetical protein
MKIVIVTIFFRKGSVFSLNREGAQSETRRSYCRIMGGMFGDLHFEP